MAQGRFAGRAALVTGGASGIGATTARMLAAEGAKVAVCDIDAGKGEDVAAAIGPAARFIALDVTSDAAWSAAVASAEAVFGPLSVVVNAAGVSIPASIEAADFEHWRKVMAINADGTFLGCKHGVAALKKAGGGAIVNVGSTLGHKAGAIFTAYCASKGAVRMLTKAVALHCAEAKLNIRVNAVLPGAIETAMFQSYVDMGMAAGASREEVVHSFASVHPLGRIGKPEEVAAAILFLASEDAAYTTGAEIPVDGGYLA
jgi:NAD(P)-dependent dehydrogenase (short-subunit alcohol dehydrogenase family)